MSDKKYPPRETHKAAIYFYETEDSVAMELTIDGKHAEELPKDFEPEMIHYLAHTGFGMITQMAQMSISELEADIEQVDEVGTLTSKIEDGPKILH